ncbi:MAG TPA: hypothetical protein VKO20_02435 [Desulfosalsimonadaceae bacterium]|nr:hypothetical protein [Desulfosalsimonadaceae bacterium]
MIQQTITSCDNIQCFLVTEHFFDYFSDDTGITTFDRAMLDLSRLYKDAVLVGAIAAAKYIQPPVEPRVTFDIDAILTEADFREFLEDSLPPEQKEVLETYFRTSDTVNHSLIHRTTGIYVDFLSASSQPVRRQLIQYILADLEETTNLLVMNAHSIRILKPELLVAMKLNRYAKKPRSEKGLTDRLDVVKLLKSYYEMPELLSPEKIRPHLGRREIKYLEEILEDVECERCESQAV